MNEVASPSARVGAVLAWAVTVALAAASLVLIALGPRAEDPADLFGGAGGVSFVLLSLAFGTVGAVIVLRVPGNVVGPIFLVTGLVTGTGIAAYQYANHTGAEGAVWLQTWATPPIAGLLGLSLLWFPDGRLPTARARLIAAVTVTGILVVALGDGLRPGHVDAPFAAVVNPTGLTGARGVTVAADSVGWLLMIAGVAGAAAVALRRLRDARGVERLQLKWVLATGTVVAAGATLLMATWFVWPHGALQGRMAVIGTGFALIPVVAGVAMLRYRLYDIDVVINRTLVYGALTLALGATYLGLVLAIGLAVGHSGFAVAVSTLAVAALFRPARERIQLFVDRRFYRGKYDAERTIERFAGRMRDAVELDALSDELRAVVGETVQPAHVSLWLRDRP